MILHKTRRQTSLKRTVPTVALLNKVTISTTNTGINQHLYKSIRPNHKNTPYGLPFNATNPPKPVLEANQHKPPETELPKRQTHTIAEEMQKSHNPPLNK